MAPSRRITNAASASSRRARARSQALRTCTPLACTAPTRVDTKGTRSRMRIGRASARARRMAGVGSPVGSRPMVRRRR